MLKRLTTLVIIFFCLSCEEQDLTSITNEINEINTRLDRIETRLDSIENKLIVIESHVADLQDQGKLFVSEFESLNSTIDNLQDLVFNLDSTTTVSLNEQLDLIQSIQTEIENFSNITEFDSLASHLAEISSVLDDLGDNAEATENSLNALDSTVNLVSQELNVLQFVETSQELKGAIEKGPFLTGSLLFLHELNDTGAQTGRSFNTTILNNFGTFDLDVVNLKGKFVRLVADGFYFNEVEDKNSLSRISLTGITRIDSTSSINVNSLTHLESPRVQYLLENNTQYDSAKAQALSEVANIFGFDVPTNSIAEEFSLVSDSVQGNLLLALSIILQGYRSESELTELMTEISSDLRADGDLDDNELGNSIVSHLFYMDENSIIDQTKTQLSKFYSSEQLSFLNPSLIQMFRSNNEFSRTEFLITCPAVSSTNHQNILNDSFTTITTGLVNLSAQLDRILLSPYEFWIQMGIVPMVYLFK